MRLVIERLPAVELEIHHPIVVPDDPEMWMRELLGGTVVATDDMTTDLGWPFVLAHGVVTSGGGVIVEHRVGAFYRFFHFVAAVVARGATGDELSGHLRALTAAACSARPDFCGDEVIALVELWREPRTVMH